jgi:hypothetical protein
LRHNTARPDIVTAYQPQPVDPVGFGEVERLGRPVMHAATALPNRRLRSTCLRRSIPALQLQQALFPLSWTGGHGTEPNEQNTQQSPASGFSFSPQPLQT